MADASGFVAMGCDEILVHGWDAVRGLGDEFTPPADLAEPVLRRLFPWAPSDAVPGPTLLWANGRCDLPGRAQRLKPDWIWHRAPLDEWNGIVPRLNANQPARFTWDEAARQWIPLAPRHRPVPELAWYHDTGEMPMTVRSRDGPARLTHVAGLTDLLRRRNTMTTTTTATVTEGLVERLFAATIDTLEVASVHIGGKLGFYRALADGGPATPAELAARTGTAPRYVREWLEQQAVAGFLTVDDGRFHLPEAHRPVFVDEENPNLLSPLATLAIGVLRPIDALLDAYRSGAGVPYESYGQDVVDGIAAINRPQYANFMADWLGAIPDVHARLSTAGARVADVACGSAWSSISIARAYPSVTVDALDVDEASIALARRNVAAAGLADRVRPAVHEAGAVALPGRYDLITIFEALHDMNHPVAALRAARASLTEAGCVLVADERVAEQFNAPGDELERFNYGWSVLHCLAVGLMDAGSAGTGTVLRPDTLRRYATEAGFAAVDILPIENDFWRFYLLRP